MLSRTHYKFLIYYFCFCSETCDSLELSSLPWRCHRLLPSSFQLARLMGTWVSLVDPCWCDVDRAARTTEEDR